MRTLSNFTKRKRDELFNTWHDQVAEFPPGLFKPRLDTPTLGITKVITAPSIVRKMQSVSKRLDCQGFLGVRFEGEKVPMDWAL